MNEKFNKWYEEAYNQTIWVMWRFSQYWTRLERASCLQLINDDDMLYPQYEYKFKKEE